MFTIIVIGGLLLLGGGVGTLIYVIGRMSTIPKIDKNTERLTVENNLLNEILDKNVEALTFLPSDYWYPMATEYLIKVVKTQRADTLKEALNMFDQQLHRWKIENVNAQMLAEKRAQTEYLNSIQKNSKISAVADVATAIGFMNRR